MALMGPVACSIAAPEKRSPARRCVGDQLPGEATGLPAGLRLFVHLKVRALPGVRALESGRDQEEMILRGPKSIWAPRPLYCAAALETTCELEGHESRVFKAQFSPVDDTLLATCSEDDTCRLWDVSEKKQLFCLKGHTEAIYSLKFSPDGSHLLTSGSDGKIIVWDLRRLEIGKTDSIAAALVQTIEIGAEAFAAQFYDERTVVCAIDDTIVLWDVETARRKSSKTVTAATDYVFGGLERNPAAMPWVFCLERNMPTGLIAAGVSDATIRLMDADLNERVIMKGHSRDVTCLRFRSDGAELLSGGGDDMAAAWDLKTMQVRHVFKGHEGTVHDCCYWPGSNEREICTVSMDRMMKFWDVDTGECRATIGPDHAAKLCLAPNQTLLGCAVAGGENKTNTGNDFCVSLLTKNHGGLDRLKAHAAGNPNRFATGGLHWLALQGGSGQKKDGVKEEKERGSTPITTSAAAKKKKKKKKKNRQAPQACALASVEKKAIAPNALPEAKAKVEDQVQYGTDLLHCIVEGGEGVGGDGLCPGDSKSLSLTDTTVAHFDALNDVAGNKVGTGSTGAGEGRKNNLSDRGSSPTGAAASLPAAAAAASAAASDPPPFAPQCLVPTWLKGAMADDEVTILGLVMCQEHVQEADFEFFTDEALKEAGIEKAISRAKMMRHIRDHFN